MFHNTLSISTLYLSALVLTAITVMSCGQLRPGVRSYDIEVTDDITYDKDHRLTFVEVLEDSRCPVGAACVAPGEAVISFEAVRNGDDVVDFNLRFGDAVTNRDTTIFDEYRIELLEVLPIPEVGNQPDPEDYEIRVVVEKLP